MTFADRLVTAWYAPHPGALARGLAPLSALFRATVAVRRQLYARGLRARQHPGVPVIVVGNITVGGTGKTPLVLALATALEQRGYRPGIVSRGTGSSEKIAHIVSAGDDPAIAGDEPLLMARRGFPVATGRQRIEAAARLLNDRPDCDVLIADDGLQHYALARDVEIAVVDGARGLGNGRLIPAGPLREPPSRLATVDAVVVNGPATRAADIPAPTFSLRLVPECFVNVRDPERVVGAEAFANARLDAVAGIGNPARFFAALRDMGLTFTAHPFPDHHAYAPTDLAFGGDAVLMTEKDAVKCARFADARWWYLRVRAEVDEALIERVLARLPAARARGP